MAHPTARALVVGALLVTAGCQGLYETSGPSSDPRAVDALDRARTATFNASSYRYTIDGQVQIRHDSRLESVDVTGHGVTNVDRRRANVTVHTRGDTPVGQRDTRVAYVDGYTLDVACARVGWARHNLSESTRWFNYTTLGQQLALLERTTVYWNGTTVVDGVETAVVTAHPTEQQLQSSHTLPTGNVGTHGGAVFENATVRVWISTETDRIRKVQREIHVRADGSTGVATITYHLSGYDEPTNVTRPSFEEYGPRWSSDCVEA